MSLKQSLFFTFQDARFTTAVAHDGTAPIRFARVAERASGSACNWIDLVVVPVGADIGRHTHPLEDEETYIIIDGRGRMELDGRTVDVGPGDVIVNRPGGTHALTNVGDTELRLVVLDVRANAPPVR